MALAAVCLEVRGNKGEENISNDLPVMGGGVYVLYVICCICYISVIYVMNCRHFEYQTSG